jgi:MjaI restriction endonuclease.
MDVMTHIDKEMIEKWIKDLVIVKTFIGLKFQGAILKSVANELKTSYRLDTPEEESGGIDGFIGEKAISIKPTTYNINNTANENMNTPIIFYEKLKDGIKVTFDVSIF